VRCTVHRRGESRKAGGSSPLAVVPR